MKSRTTTTTTSAPIKTSIHTRSSALQLIVRLLFIGSYAFHHWYMRHVISNCPVREKLFYQDYQRFGGRWRYLTAINESLVTAYVVSAFITEVLPIHFLKAHMKRFCDWMFTCGIWPLTMIVTSFFWSMYIYDRELIFPSKNDVCIPQLLNHGWHTLPLIVAVLETVFFVHKFPSNFVAYFTTLFFSTGYTIWVLVIHYKTNEWVYPFMEVFTPLTFATFTTVSAAVGIGFFFIGKLFSFLVWGSISSH